MSRIAIIIESSNVVGESDLPGARVDQQNWINFLTSELGGSWGQSEIIRLSKPYSSEVENLLESHKDKYCFVTYSGHGCEGTVALNDHFKSFPTSKLRPKGEKGTLIIDSCRGLEEARTMSFSAKQQAKNVYLAEASEGRKVIANSSRGYQTKFASERALSGSMYKFSWRMALIQAKTGIVEMLACSSGEGADEDPNAGGYYTSLLLQSADLWEKAGGIGSIHTTKQAHNHAAAHLPPQQTPEYFPLSLAYPFAVSV